jgi:hypothetical protein
MARIGSVRGEVPTSHIEIWLRDMTHIKRGNRHWGHGALGSNARVHISGPERGLHGQRHINRKMTRDPRHRLSIIVPHIIMKNRRIKLHELSMHHGVGSGK